MSTSLLLAASLDSLTYWSLAFLIAAGLTVVFGMLGFLNAAHTTFFMLGTYVAYSIEQYTGSFWLALAVAPLAIAIFGLILERLLFQRFYAAGHVAQLLLTIGLAYVIAEFMKLIWGDSAMPVRSPIMLAGHFNLLDATIPVYHLFIVIASLILLGGLAGLIKGTRLGMIIRAAAVYPDMLSTLGYRTRDIYSLVFFLGAYLAAFAGVVIAPLTGAYPGMANDALVQAFIIVVAGGLGSLPGAFIAAGLLGVVQGFGSIFFSNAAMFFPFIVLGVILLLRPHGLLGGKAL